MPTNIEDASTINSYTPTVYWSTTTGTNTNEWIKLDPSGLSLNIAPSNITTTYNGKDQEEYIEKLEKHIDELEEDIEYFNKQLQEKDDMIHFLLDKENELKKKSSDMDLHISYLETRLNALEDRTNEMVRTSAAAML